MSKWKQVGGDLDWSGVGCVLARDNRAARQVDLIRITPWLEMDSSALSNGYGFWDVCTATVDYEEMGVDLEEVQDAIAAAGLDVLEYKRAAPADKANLILEHRGYEDSRSTSDIAEALPRPVEKIAFFAGTTSASELPGINAQMRREVTYKLYGNHFGHKVPTSDALGLAMGDDPFEMDLDDAQAQALRYALAAKAGFDLPRPRDSDSHLKVDGTTAMRELLGALLEAPRAKDLPAETVARLASAYRRDFDVEDQDPQDLVDEDARNARDLYRDIIGEMGF